MSTQSGRGQREWPPPATWWCRSWDSQQLTLRSSCYFKLGAAWEGEGLLGDPGGGGGPPRDPSPLPPGKQGWMRCCFLFKGQQSTPKGQRGWGTWALMGEGPHFPDTSGAFFPGSSGRLPAFKGCRVPGLPFPGFSMLCVIVLSLPRLPSRPTEFHCPSEGSQGIWPLSQSNSKGSPCCIPGPVGSSPPPPLPCSYLQLLP